MAFTESLGCYDRVLPYEAVDQLSPAVATAYLDFAGSADVRARIRGHLGERLVHEAVVGVTHQDQSGAQALGGPRTTVFFAPDQMRKRSADWGREGLDSRFAVAGAVSRPPPKAGSTWSATAAPRRCGRYGSKSWPATAHPAPATW